jgi:hypothetical protein
MELRSSIRPPVRYTECEIPELPRPPRFVHPTISYNPNLPRAAFPTLDASLPRRSKPPPVLGAPQTPQSMLEPGETPKQAIVFRDPRSLPRNDTQKRDSHDETCSANDPAVPPPKRVESLEDPGEFEAYGYFSESEDGGKKRRARLRVSIQL